MTGYGNKEKAISIKKPFISKFGGSVSNEIQSKFYYLSGEKFQTAPVCNTGFREAVERAAVAGRRLKRMV